MFLVVERTELGLLFRGGFFSDSFCADAMVGFANDDGLVTCGTPRVESTLLDIDPLLFVPADCDFLVSRD